MARATVTAKYAMDEDNYKSLQLQHVSLKLTSIIMKILFFLKQTLFPLSVKLLLLDRRTEVS